MTFQIRWEHVVEGTMARNWILSLKATELKRNWIRCKSWASQYRALAIYNGNVSQKTADSDLSTEANIVHFINCSYSCISGRKFVLVINFVAFVFWLCHFGLFLCCSFFVQFVLFFCFFVRRLRQSHPEDPAPVSLNTRGILQLGAALYSFNSVQRSSHKLRLEAKD